MAICARSVCDNTKAFGGRIRTWLLNVAIPVALASSPWSAASAATLTPFNASYNGTLTLFTGFIFGAPPPHQTISAPGTLTDSVRFDASAPDRKREARLVLDATPLPRISAQLLVHDSPGSTTDGTSVSASITYYALVNGPLSGVIVPIDMKLAWNITASKETDQSMPLAQFSHSTATVGFATEPFVTGDDPSANVSVTVDTNNLGPAQTTCSGPDIGLCSAGAEYSGVIHFNVKSRSEIMVAMNLGLSNIFGGRAQGFIDPIISIDPAFLQANPGYSLSLSDGIGNTAPSAVPVPAALSFLAPALGALVMMRRRTS